MISMIPYPGVKSTGLIFLRSLTFVLVCGVIIIWLGYPTFLQGPLLAYGLITLASFILLVLSRRWRVPLADRVLAAMSFISEIICEAGIVYTTGTLYSPFAALFLLTIVSAALVYRLVGTILVATVVSIAYIGVTWINAGLFVNGGLPGLFGKEGLFAGDDILFYSTFLHILIFYLVAFTAGYLAQKLQSKDRELHSASAELYRARLATGDILRHLNSGLLTMTSRGEIDFFNHAAETILGLAGEQVSGQDCRQVFAGRLEPLAENLLSVLASRNRAARRELEIIDANGNPVPIGISTSLLFDDNKDVRGLIAIFQDISQAKLWEERVRQADRMAAVGELAAYMAHEIRNPLAAISGSVEVLQNDLVLDGDNQRLMSLILTETSRLNKILSDFLMYTRVGRLRFEKIDVHRLISDTVEIVRRHPAYAETITIELEGDTGPTFIFGDADQIKQLLLNLAVNACEVLGDKGGVIRFGVTTRTDDDGSREVTATVRDNGPGIPPENLSKIFLPFFSTKKRGTGLGLAIVSRLMEAHRGRVEVSSRPGQGTEFRLFFNAVPEESTPPQATISAPAAR